MDSVGDFPGGSVVRALCFHYRGHRFNPWLGNFAAQPKGGKKKIGSIYVVWKHNFLWNTMISFPLFPFRDRFSVLVLDL